MAKVGLLTALWLATWPAVAAPLAPAVAPVVPATVITCTAAADVSGDVPLASPQPAPHKPVLCQRSFCWEEGLRCLFTSTGPGGCCYYGDCIVDPTCNAPDPLPINMCR